MNFEDIYEHNRFVESSISNGSPALTKENWEKIKGNLNDFITNINKGLESIENRHKHSEQIDALKGMVSSAEGLLKKLNSPVILNAINVIQQKGKDLEKVEGED